MDVLCGIVTYNPELTKLKANIYAISDQVKEIIIVDNGSSNVDEIENSFNVKIIKNGKNFGIATALNEIMQYGEQNNYSWVLTLDQDSICPPNIIEEFENYKDIDAVGILCPKILYKDNSKLSQENKEVKEIEWCITSGSMLNVLAWRDIGGFDEELFIDLVDKDICLRLKLKNYKIIQIGLVEMYHELGNLKSISIGKLHLWIGNHSAFRKYYIIRNTVILRKKFGLSHLATFCDIFLEYLKVIFFEHDKMKKLRLMNRGLKDAKRYKAKI